MFSPFREGFIFTKFAYAKFRENKTLAKISEFTGKTLSGPSGFAHANNIGGTEVRDATPCLSKYDNDYSSPPLTQKHRIQLLSGARQ